MHFSTAFALFAASTALATPLSRRQNDTSVQSLQYGGDERVSVILRSSYGGGRSKTTFENVDSRQAAPLKGRKGPFTTVEIAVAENAPNQDLRCKVIDNNGRPVIGTRGENTDITFSDAGKGPWTFLDNEEVYVSKVICNPAFVQAAPDAFDVTVILQNQGTELGTQTVFENFSSREKQAPVGSSGPFETVELVVGEFVDPQTLRCAILNQAGRRIPIIRNGNRDSTFADGDAGLWTFVKESKVANIVCDPAFQAMPTPVAA